MPGDEQRESFVRNFGGIYEHSPWVAERAFPKAAGVNDPERLAQLLAAEVDRAPEDAKLRLIRAHPDLAGRAAVAGQLGAASTEEQASAGIDQCTPEEFSRFQTLNRRYKQKFGFPFVMAVRGSSRQAILAGFEERLENDRETEFARAIEEIHKIAKLRLQVDAL
ncbi:MAG: 2-oxo-4-hydroxy-4-carboxy-5-ureidoimidazoline decarboxylase [Woeseia sp.]